MNNNKKTLMVMLGIGVASGVVFAAAAEADEVPSRRPGLWEVRTSIGDNSRVLEVQQCIDAATDQLLQSSAGPFSASLCAAREVKKSEGSITIDSHCTVGGKAGTAHAVISGSFESAYAMKVTSEGGGLPPAKMSIEGKWLGACAAGQQPGDVIMAGGAKVNIPELQKRALGPADPSQPGT